MSLSAIIWMILFLTVIWGGLGLLIAIAVIKDRKDAPAQRSSSETTSPDH